MVFRKVFNEINLELKYFRMNESSILIKIKYCKENDIEKLLFNYKIIAG